MGSFNTKGVTGFNYRGEEYVLFFGVDSDSHYGGVKFISFPFYMVYEDYGEYVANQNIAYKRLNQFALENFRDFLSHHGHILESAKLSFDDISRIISAHIVNHDANKIHFQAKISSTGSAKILKLKIVTFHKQYYDLVMNTKLEYLTSDLPEEDANDRTKYFKARIMESSGEYLNHKIEILEQSSESYHGGFFSQWQNKLFSGWMSFGKSRVESLSHIFDNIEEISQNIAQIIHLYNFLYTSGVVIHETTTAGQIRPNNTRFQHLEYLSIVERSQWSEYNEYE